MPADGIAVHNRVDTTTERKLHAKVVDNVLSGATYGSRLMGMGKRMVGKTKDFTIKITDSGLGETFSGLETLSTTASDTTITLSYAHNAFTQPIVVPFLEALANGDSETQTIPLGAFKTDEAGAEATAALGTLFYGLGAGDDFNGLQQIIDDGTNAGTIGGQSRTTYSQLNAIYTDSGGTLALAKLGVMHDATTAAGIGTEEPNLHLTGKTVWSLFEQLLHPTVRQNYQGPSGYPVVPIRGSAMTTKAELKGGIGFTSLGYRGAPVLKDDAAPAQKWFMVNERYIGWFGRSVVPPEFKGQIEKVNLGNMATLEGVAAQELPSQFNGWFHQKPMMLPNQAGIVSRYYVVGQLCTSQPRRHGQLYGITGV